jgi:hypothetical protein
MTGYMIGPGVTVQLVDDGAVIRPDIRSWLRRFPARSLLSLLCQAVHRGEVTSSAARAGRLGPVGRKIFTNAIEHCVNRRKAAVHELRLISDPCRLGASSVGYPL